MAVETITFSLDSSEIRTLCASDSKLALVIRHFGDLTYTIHTDPFAHMIENIVGQMLSIKAAGAISARLYTLCGGELTPEAIVRINITELRSIGLSRQKADYISNIALMARDNPRYFNGLEHLQDSEVIKRLTEMRGIGTWSAKMHLIFVLNRLNVLPYEDGAFLQSYRWLYSTNDIKPASIIERCAPWAPFSSIAARYMYRALDQDLMRNQELGDKLKEI